MNCEDQERKEKNRLTFSELWRAEWKQANFQWTVKSRVKSRLWKKVFGWLISNDFSRTIPNRKETKNRSKNTLALEVIKRVNLHSHWQTKSFTQRQRDAPAGSFLVILPSHSVHEKNTPQYMSNQPLWTYKVLCRRFVHSFISPTWTTKLSSPLPWMANITSCHMQPKIHLNARSA